MIAMPDKCSDTENDMKKIVKRSKFNAYDDARLRYYVSLIGDNKWFEVSVLMGNKTSRQCRERYQAYLSPSIVNRVWSDEEDLQLYAKYCEMGPKWSQIATLFPGRSSTAIKNRLMLILRKKKNTEYDVFQSFEPD